MVKYVMKRYVPTAVLLLTLLTSPLAVKAQVGEYRTDLAVGINGGYVLSNVSFVPTVPQTMLGGMTGGVTVRYTCEKYFKSICAIVAEVNYAQLGWKEDIRTVDDQPVMNQGEAEAYERRINYVQVPVMARLGWGRERRGAQFFFQVGPQLGFYLSESTKTNFDVLSANHTDRASHVVAQDSMAVEKKFDYGIAAGLGVEYSVPKVGHFLVEGRYYYGLGNIYGNSKRDYFGRSNFGNIVIKVSYLFDIVKTRNNKIK